MNTENKRTQKPQVLRAHMCFVISKVIVKGLKWVMIVFWGVPVSRALPPFSQAPHLSPDAYTLWLLLTSSFLYHLAGAPSSEGATFLYLPHLVLPYWAQRCVSCHHTLPWSNQRLRLLRKYFLIQELCLSFDHWYILGNEFKLLNYSLRAKKGTIQWRDQNVLSSSVCAHLSQPRLLLGWVFYCQFLCHHWIWARKYLV